MTDRNARIESPCIRVCCLDPDDVCLGCFRTLTEITQWTRLDDDARLLVLKNAKERQALYGQDRAVPKKL